MIQLSLETSTRSASVCVLQDETILAEYSIDPATPGTSAILPVMSNLLLKSGLTATDIQQVCVSIGPGSFTGLRMGIATAKTFAWANRCKLFGIPTHQIIAEQARVAQRASQPDIRAGLIATVIDAQRGEWFAEIHQFSPLAGIKTLSPSTIVDPQTFLDSLDPTCLVCGPGLTKHQQNIRLPAGIRLASQQHWIPAASTAGQIAATHPESGREFDPFELKPVYGRQSAAEEKHS